MLRIEQKIYDIDKVICGNLDMIDWPAATRDLISQNLLSQSRNLVEHIAVRAYCNGEEIALNWETIPKALAYLKENNKYLFLRKFHFFLQESKHLSSIISMFSNPCFLAQSAISCAVCPIR